MLSVLLKADSIEEYYELRDDLMKRTIDFAELISQFNNNGKPILKSIKNE